MDARLTYLTKYLTDPRVLTHPRADDPALAGVPDWWLEVLAASGGERVRRTLRVWDAFRPQLPGVVEHLSTHLRDVNLLTYTERVNGTTPVVLLYEVAHRDGPLYYAGGNPINPTPSAAVRAVWDRLPADFRRFHDTLHNGWCYLASDSMGPSRTEDCFIIGSQEWGILDDIGDPGCDPNDLLAVFSNGMGDFVTLSVGRREYKDVLWWKDKPPEVGIDAWAVIDAWTVMGFDVG